MKYYLVIITQLIYLQAIFAQQVSKEYASKVAEHFYITNPQNEKQFQNVNIVNVFEDIDSISGKTNFYAINFSDTGFVLVSGEFGVEPILAYSYTTFYTGTDLPFSLQGLLSEYRSLVVHIQKYEQNLGAENMQLWNSIVQNTYFSNKDFKPFVKPIIPCTWDQGSFYNNLCPEDPAGPQGHVYAGCVATAMGMIMYHYRYPEKGRYSKGYYSDYGYLHVDFSQSDYSWNNMPSRLTSANFDVAKLLYELGVSVEMMYSPNGSGAYMEDAAYAMKTYFKYNSNLSIKYRNNFTLQNWIQLLKSQLNQNMPLIYAGYGSQGPGHAFVCDGYDIQDYFHFNWGWSGTYNGYYRMDYLTPGGYSFSSWQMAIVDVFPDDANYPYGCNAQQIITSPQGSISDGSGHINYENNTFCSWLISPEIATEKIIARFTQLQTQEGIDEVCIYDGADENAPLLGCFSGYNPPTQDIVSTGDKMYITFYADEAIADNGFYLTFTSQKQKFCEHFQLLPEPSGYIEDGSNLYNYHDNTLCRWLIKPDGAGAITLWFDEFDTEQNADFLILFDPSTYPSKEIKRFSGTQVPEPYTHFGNSLILLFTSNGFHTGSGWKLQYTSWTASIEESISTNIQMYPNPFFDCIYISSHTEDFFFEMYDISGQTVYKSTGVANTTEVYELPNLPEGIYFIKIITASGSYVSKHIKM